MLKKLLGINKAQAINIIELLLCFMIVDKQVVENEENLLYDFIVDHDFTKFQFNLDSIIANLLEKLESEHRIGDSFYFKLFEALQGVSYENKQIIIKYIEKLNNIDGKLDKDEKSLYAILCKSWEM